MNLERRLVKGFINTPNYKSKSCKFNFMIEIIINSLEKTKNKIDIQLNNFPNKQGIYAFYLSESANLFEFGKEGQLIYLGISNKSLKQREITEHLKSGATGKSSLRRSLGAILKKRFNLTAIPRGGENDTKKFTNYKFIEEVDLTNWMIENLWISYYAFNLSVENNKIRDLEKHLTLQLKPTLDLDIRTRKFNPLAKKIIALRKLCCLEAEQNKYFNL